MNLRGLVILAVLAVLVAVGVLAFWRLEGEPPVVTLPELAVIGRGAVSIPVEISDEESGLRSVEARLEHAGGTVELAAEGLRGGLLEGGAPSSHATRLDLEIDPAALGLPDGPLRLVVDAYDWSWRGGFDGNHTEAVLDLVLDTVPPRLAVETGLTYVTRGGAAVAVYRVDEETAQDGVQVADAFFPGYPIDGGRRAAIFALPVEGPKSPAIRVVAEDAAGNRAESRFAVRVKERQFPDTEVGLPETFLHEVARPLAEASGLDAPDDQGAFRRVNTELRAANEAKIRELSSTSRDGRLFSGAFEQWANSAVRSRFAEHRVYRVGGVANSEARHYGYDLASISNAPITAANRGIVVFADDLGIYGRCVIVDHGLGVHTLYGHLSQIDVSPGDEVAKGQTLGLSGATGLAGGDHLHFAVLVGGEYVDPVEWWDPSWVEDHVDARIGPGPDDAR